MALQWQFNMKAGIVTEVQNGHPFDLTFYEGNALMITTYEYADKKSGEDMYDLMWFFTGKDHAERMLGLQPLDNGEKENVFGEDGITRLVIYREYCRQWKTIVDLFTRAFPHIVIEIHEKAPAKPEPVPEGGDLQ